LLKSLVPALIFALIGFVAVAPSMLAQDAAATAAAEVKVVTLPVTVRDKKGKIVRDLTKDDFTLQEDGRPQTIRSFASNADLRSLSACLSRPAAARTKCSTRSGTPAAASWSRCWCRQKTKHS